MSSFTSTIKRIWYFLRRSWFILTIAIVLVLFLIGYFDDIPALMTTSIVILSLTIAGLIVQIVFSYLKFRTFKSFLESHTRIDDVSIARSINNELTTVRRQLSELMEDQKTPGLIILLKNTYIYYNSSIVKSFKKFMSEEDFNTKVYSLLSKNFDLYKNEVQAIRKQLEEREESD